MGLQHERHTFSCRELAGTSPFFQLQQLHEMDQAKCCQTLGGSSAGTWKATGGVHTHAVGPGVGRQCMVTQTEPGLHICQVPEQNHKEASSASMCYIPSCVSQRQKLRRDCGPWNVLGKQVEDHALPWKAYTQSKAPASLGPHPNLQ